MTKVLITGITGQDGYYLAKECHDRGWEVYGLVRGQSNPKIHLLPDYVILVYGDLTDQKSLCAAFDAVEPDYVFNLGAITYIPFSWEQPELTYNVNYLGVARLLEECEQHDVERFIQASTSEMFGRVQWREPLDEDSPMNPRSPYAISKLAAHHLCLSYRDAGKVQAVSAIMFNHESPRRGENFVTRKITLGMRELILDKNATLDLGSTLSVRDWGYAPEYMNALCELASFKGGIQGSYVIATGVEATVADFARRAAERAGVDIKRIRQLTPENMRPNDVSWLKGNPEKIFKEIGWKAKTTWKELADLMVDADMRLEELEY